MKLKNLAIQKAQPKEKPYKLFDGEGLYLEVTPKGRKYWRMKYYYLGTEKRLAFGVYPTVSLSEARDKRLDAKRALDKGLDPSVLKQEEKQRKCSEAENTFEVLAREWHSHNAANWTERNAGYVMRRLEKRLFPYIGNIPLAKLTRKDMLTAVQHTEDDGKHDLAHRLGQYCRQICSYGVWEEKLEHNPAAELSQSLKPYKRTHHAALEATELPDFIRSINKNDARLKQQTRCALRLIMLTFVRTSELINARWDEIDFENAQWTIPAERMKTRQPHLVPLAEQTLAIFKELQEMNGEGELVFPNQNNPQKAMSNSTILKAIEYLGYKGRTTGHGFRALAMTTIQEKLGYDYAIPDRQLAHAPKTKVQAAYDRAKFLEQRTTMMQEWADYLDECAKGE